MLLAILPDEARTTLGEAGHPSLTAVWRPMSLTDKAAWFDLCEGNVDTAIAKVRAVRLQLLRIEGLEVENAEAQRVPFDPKEDKHFAVLPMSIILPVYFDIIARTTVAEPDAKN